MRPVFSFSYEPFALLQSTKHLYRAPQRLIMLARRLGTVARSAAMRASMRLAATQRRSFAG